MTKPSRIYYLIVPNLAISIFENSDISCRSFFFAELFQCLNLKHLRRRGEVQPVYRGQIFILLQLRLKSLK